MISSLNVPPLSLPSVVGEKCSPGQTLSPMTAQGIRCGVLCPVLNDILALYTNPVGGGDILGNNKLGPGNDDDDAQSTSRQTSSSADIPSKLNIQ